MPWTLKVKIKLHLIRMHLCLLSFIFHHVKQKLTATVSICCFATMVTGARYSNITVPYLNLTSMAWKFRVCLKVRHNIIKK